MSQSLKLPRNAKRGAKTKNEGIKSSRQIRQEASKISTKNADKRIKKQKKKLASTIRSINQSGDEQ